MRGSVHGPGGKFIVELLLQLHLLTILINTKMKIRKDAIKVISIVGGTMAR
jgi:hypothetical protein